MLPLERSVKKAASRTVRDSVRYRSRSFRKPNTLTTALFPSHHANVDILNCVKNLLRVRKTDNSCVCIWC